MGPGVLEEILSDFPHTIHPDLLVGFSQRDDAGIYRLNDETALIQTVDFLTPMVDDPFIFGQIAAVNAINDIYAMGGQPLLAMNIVCYPECEDLSILKGILQGGLNKIKESGALLVGGHSVDDPEPKYGLSVTGLVHPQKIITNSAARPGDVLYLTKPLGNGIIATAIKAEMVEEEPMQEAIDWMRQLNRDAAMVMQETGIRAATDVTGFGLLGHIYEMAWASQAAVEIYWEQVPLISGVLDYASWGLVPGGAYRNRDYLLERVRYEREMDPVWREILFSPETAGGLIIAAEEQKAERLERAMQQSGVFHRRIGRVLSPGFKPINIC